MNDVFFKNLVEHAPDLISVINEEGMCLYVNKAYEEDLGFRKEDLLGKHFAAAVQLTEDSRTLVLQLFPLIVSGLSIDFFKVQIYDKQGQLHTYDVRYQLIDEGIQVLLRDVTEQQILLREKYELVEQNKLLAETLDFTEIGIIITDPHQHDNPIIYANKGFELLTGYDHDQILGKNCRFLQGELTDPSTVNEIRDGLQKNREVKVEILNYRKNQTTFWNELTINPVFTSKGEISHYIGVQIDVTKRKLLELELKRDLTISRNLQHLILSKPHEDDFLSIKGFYAASRELGGDFYKWKKLSDHLYVVMIIDVMGHGIASSLLTMSLNAEISSLIRRGIYHPGEVLTRLNQHMFEIFTMEKSQHLIQAYFTCVYLLIDTTTKSIAYINAGHPSFFIKGDVTREVPSHTVPVGMIKDYVFQVESLTYEPSTDLYMYTDGLLDYYNCRVKEIDPRLNEHTLYNLQTEQRIQTAQDDICFIHVRFKG